MHMSLYTLVNISTQGQYLRLVLENVTKQLYIFLALNILTGAPYRKSDNDFSRKFLYQGTLVQVLWIPPKGLALSTNLRQGLNYCKTIIKSICVALPKVLKGRTDLDTLGSETQIWLFLFTSYCPGQTKISASKVSVVENCCQFKL
jgi:hypothetical protein